MDNPTITDELLAAYQQAKYVVQVVNGDIILKVGEANSDLDNWLGQHNADTAAFITPENPFSNQLSDNDNSIRHRDFLADLKKENLIFVAGYGVDYAEMWQREISYLILIKSKETAYKLASSYKQNGWLLCQKTKPVELICLPTSKS